MSGDGALAARYRAVLRAGDLDALRALALLSGLPGDANALGGGGGGGGGRCSLRGLVWKALLGLGPLDPLEYAAWVRKGPSADDHRVREDARRTFSKNDDFCARVPNAKIIRVLNAYVHASGNTPGIYAQSMSLLAAPFLYVMPEPDAFHCFRVFLTSHVPQYVRRYAGARRGCRLLDRCLADVDPPLHALFLRHKLNAEVYAFPSVSSLGACVPPISDTVRLWDVQLAFGAHMHIVFTLARLVLASPAIRDRAAGAAPLITRELEQGLGVDAETVLARAVPLVHQLDPELYDELIDHAHQPPPDDAEDGAGGGPAERRPRADATGAPGPAPTPAQGRGAPPADPANGREGVRTTPTSPLPDAVARRPSASVDDHGTASVQIM
jgi:cell cycle arrest protein BUB2